MNRLQSNRMKNIWRLILGLLVLVSGKLFALEQRERGIALPVLSEMPAFDDGFGDDDGDGASEVSDFVEPEVYKYQDLYHAVRACDTDLDAVQKVLGRPGAPASFADSVFGLYGSPLHWLVTDNSKLNQQAIEIASVLLERGVSMGVINGDNRRAYEVLTDYVTTLRVMPVPEPAGGEEHHALVKLHYDVCALVFWLEVHDELWEAQHILEQQAAAFIAAEDAAYNGGDVSDLDPYDFDYSSDMDCS